MREVDFIESIDCRFPYGDPAESKRLIAASCGISANAAFAVAYELAHPGHGTGAPIATRLASLAQLRDAIDHPLSRSILDLVERMIKDEQVTNKEAMVVMGEVAKYPGQYSALSIAYMSSDDSDGIVEPLYESIVAVWNAV